MSLVDWRHVSLLGIDVGFSESRKTTGIAIYTFGQPARLHCVGSLFEHRAAVLSDGALHDAIAIDGPVVPAAASANIAARHCEHVLAKGLFGQRCKAGFSHFGAGLQLRIAATTIANEMPLHRRGHHAPVVEAFPNAFLGVMLDDDTYHRLGRVARGQKSDVYFAQASQDHAFDRLFEWLQWNDRVLREQIRTVADVRTRVSHEHRAALVCLLTSACALSGHAKYIGDDAGGRICLPPIELWADWARDAIER